MEEEGGREGEGRGREGGGREGGRREGGRVKKSNSEKMTPNFAHHVHKNTCMSLL